MLRKYASINIKANPNNLLEIGIIIRDLLTKNLEMDVKFNASDRTFDYLNEISRHTEGHTCHHVCFEH